MKFDSGKWRILRDTLGWGGEAFDYLDETLADPDGAFTYPARVAGGLSPART